MITELFVVRDNATRWNSVFESIHRALKLKDRITLLCTKFPDKLGDDTLSENDWQELADIECILQPFQDVTKRLEGRGKKSKKNGKLGQHGMLWEALPAIESLIKHLDEMKKVFKQSTHPNLAHSINLAWSKLDDYYLKMDETPAYALALLVHPRFRWTHFELNWKGHLARYKSGTKKAMREVYDTQYKKDLEVDDDEQLKEADFLDNYLDETAPTLVKDEFKEYADGARIRAPENVFKWWAGETHLPNMCQLAFDHLSVPAMSSENERNFSDAKLIISDQRMRLGCDIVEALECLHHWEKSSL